MTGPGSNLPRHRMQAVEKLCRPGRKSCSSEIAGMRSRCGRSAGSIIRRPDRTRCRSLPSFSDIFEFILAEWLLVSAWLWLIFALLWLNRMRSGERINSVQLVRMINQGSPVIVDLRPSQEYSAGHIKGAINIPATKLAKSMHQLEKHREEPLVLVCSLGQAAPGVARTLGEAGYDRVHCLMRGVLGWSDDSLPLVKKALTTRFFRPERSRGASSPGD